MYIPDINELNLCTDGSSTPQDDILRISSYFDKKNFQAEKVIFLQTFTGWISEKNDLRFDSSTCLLYTSPSPRDLSTSRMPSSA